MHRQKWKKIIGITLGVILAVQPVKPFMAGSLEEAQQEKKELQDALDETHALIQDLKGSKSNILDKVTQLDAQLTKISTDINNLESQLEDKNLKISDTSKVLKEAQEDAAVQYENMKIRIRYMYENGTDNYMATLLSAQSFSDFLNAVEYIRQITLYDRQMLEKYQKTQVTVADAKNVLEQEKAELEQMQSKVEEEKQAVSMLLSAKESELLAVNEDIREANNLADAYEAEIIAQDEMIAQIRAAEEAKKKAREKAAAEAKAKAEAEAAAAAAEAEAAAAQDSTEDSGDGTETQNSTEEAQDGTEKPQDSTEKPQDSTEKPQDSTEKPQEESSETTAPETEPEPLPEDTYNGGAFLWPCPASTRVTSEYGNRESPTAGASSNHKGIDIGAPYGSDIVAAADGVVIASDYSSSGGNYVMIDHGGSLYTVYMHASSRCVSRGDKVTRGQVVAKVGSTGISTGNHLHFGVSLNGEYVSPWNYLSK